MAKQTSFYDVFLPIVKSYNYFQIGYYGGGYSSIDEKCKEQIPEPFNDDAYFEFLDEIPNNDKQQVAKEMGNCIYRYDEANRRKQYRDKVGISLKDINVAIDKDLKIVQSFKQLVKDATHDYRTISKDKETNTTIVKETGRTQILNFVEEMERVLIEKDFGDLIQKGRYYKEVPITHSTKKELKADLIKLFSKYKLKDKQLRIEQIVSDFKKN